MDTKPIKISDELLAAYLEGNVTADEASRVLAATATDPVLMRVLALCSEIDDDPLDDSEDDTSVPVLRVLPMRALAAANPGNLCSFDCETAILRRLGIQADHWSLLETAKANNWLRDGGTPLHHVGRILELKGVQVERTYEADITRIRKALDAANPVIAILGAAGNILHAVCITTVTDQSVSCLDARTGAVEVKSFDEFNAAWELSGRFMLTAYAGDFRYNPQPIRVDDIPLDGSLAELTEAIAENAHDIWARQRMDEGWTYGAERNDALRTHPDLVPYAALPEREKEYDRIMAMNTIRLVKLLGYDITDINRRKY